MIKFYTTAHKRPDFILLQLQSFRQNLKHDFELIVFNNAVFDLDLNNYNQIKNICINNNIQCIDIEKDQNIINQTQHQVFGDEYYPYMSSSIACGYPLCFAWHYYISKTDDKICIIDSDMFFLDSEINIDNKLDIYDVIFHPQGRDNANYMWNGLVAMNLSKIPNKQNIDWWCGIVNGSNCDVGGMTHHWLLANNVNKLHWSHEKISVDENVSFNPPNYEFFGINSKSILHLRGGSNWDRKSQDYHNKKTQWLINLLNR